MRSTDNPVIPWMMINCTASHSAFRRIVAYLLLCTCCARCPYAFKRANAHLHNIIDALCVSFQIVSLFSVREKKEFFLFILSSFASLLSLIYYFRFIFGTCARVCVCVVLSSPHFCWPSALFVDRRSRNNMKKCASFSTQTQSYPLPTPTASPAHTHTLGQLF